MQTGARQTAPGQMAVDFRRPQGKGGQIRRSATSPGKAFQARDALAQGVQGGMPGRAVPGGAVLGGAVLGRGRHARGPIPKIYVRVLF